MVLIRVDKPLVVPVNKKFVSCYIKRRYSFWWVPELGIKRDAIPVLCTNMAK